MRTSPRTPPGSQRAVAAPRICACGGRIEPATNGNGAVVDQCSRCGAKPGQGRALTSVMNAASPARGSAGAKCTVKGCPGQLNESGTCLCCRKREQWASEHMPKRRCGICEGEIGGRSLKYCEACKPVAQCAAVAAHHAGTKKRG